MSKLGKKLIKAAKEGVEIAKVSDVTDFTHDIDVLLRLNKRIRNETIEECARVALEYENFVSGHDDPAVVIAAAIRALKEKT